MMDAIYTSLAPVVSGLAPTRSRLAKVYDAWLNDTRRNDPVNFCHAVVLTAERVSDHLPEPGRHEDALRLALAALVAPEAAHACFAALVGAGLFDHQTHQITPVLAALQTQAPAAFDLVVQDNPLIAAQNLTAAAEMHEDARTALWRQILVARALVALGGETPKSRTELQNATVQSMVTHDAFWNDPGTLLPAIIHGRRRICIIETFPDGAEPTQGTGFLVGPSAVLTSWHVVDGLPLHLEDPTQLQIRFDFSETTAQAQVGNPLVLPMADWCLTHGMRADEGPNEDYWWDDDTKRRAWLDVCKDQLDFAIIRLAEAPGLRRGWYPLSTARRRRPVGTWALHHPAGNEHTLTKGKVKYSQHIAQRLFHTASTVGGSSGGLILDQDGAALGLHYAGMEAKLPPDADKPEQVHQVLNAAISLRQIALQVEKENLLAAVEETSILRPPRGTLADNRPVFGRGPFFEALAELWSTSAARILRVDLIGQPDALRRGGKSYSADMLRAVFHGPEHHHILFRAGDIKVDAAKAAEEALRSFAEDMIATMPSEHDTTTPAFVRGLVAHLGRAIQERLAGKTVWLIMDDLDKHSLADASGREFLATLYAQVNEIDNLRIVLIGLPAGLRISGIAPETERVTLLAPGDAEGLRESFTAWMQEHSQGQSEITDAGYKLLGGIATSVAQGEAPLEAMARFAQDHVGPLLATLRTQGHTR